MQSLSDSDIWSEVFSTKPEIYLPVIMGQVSYRSLLDANILDYFVIGFLSYEYAGHKTINKLL